MIRSSINWMEHWIEMIRSFITTIERWIETIRSPNNAIRL
jgi:hypothetical protein